MTLHVEMDIPADRATIEAALEGLTAANVRIMIDGIRAGRRYPRLYDTRVRYRRESPGRENWKNADLVLDDGEGDCEDLSGYVAAWKRLFAGQWARMVCTDHGDGHFHAKVANVDGTIEDP